MEWPIRKFLSILGHVGPPLPCNLIKLIDVPEMDYYSKDGTGEVTLFLVTFSLIQLPWCCLLKARLHRRFLLRSFSLWCMRLNRLTYECIRPSVQSYIINTFVTQPLNRMRQNEKNRHKNRPCERALELRLHTAINRADFVSWWMWFNDSPTKVQLHFLRNAFCCLGAYITCTKIRNRPD